MRVKITCRDFSVDTPCTRWRGHYNVDVRCILSLALNGHSSPPLDHIRLKMTDRVSCTITICHGTCIVDLSSVSLK